MKVLLQPHVKGPYLNMHLISNVFILGPMLLVLCKILKTENWKPFSFYGTDYWTQNRLCFIFTTWSLNPLNLMMVGFKVWNIKGLWHKVCKDIGLENKIMRRKKSVPFVILFDLWPNLKNWSGGLNLSRGLYMVGST